MDSILILLIIHYVLYFIFGKKSNRLHCGLFGFMSDTKGKLNVDKLKILGLYNDSRGGDSVGLYSNNIIIKRIGLESTMKGFLSRNYFGSIDDPKSLIICHTRKSSVGGRTVENAHPFSFGIKRERISKGVFRNKYELIGMHNGTLRNHEELAKKYEVPTERRTGKNSRVSLTDSEILLSIIHKTWSFDVLSEYIGAASLVWTTLEPDNSRTLHFFRGESKNSTYSKEQSKERPLYYWQKSENELYYSSLEESLFAIGALENEIKEFEANTVYSVKDGNIDKAVKVKISRDGATQTLPYASGFTSRNSRGYGSYGGVWDQYEDDLPYLNPNRQLALTSAYYDDHLLNDNPKKFNAAYNEPYVKKDRATTFTRFQYRDDKGKLLEGVYTFVYNYGYFFLSNSNKEAIEVLRSIKGKRIVNGKVSDKSRKGIMIPVGATFHYFKSGIRLKTVMDYIASTNPLNNFSILQLSHCSHVPVMVYKENNEIELIRDGELYSGKISPLGADYTYTVKNGIIVNREETAVYKEYKERLKNEILSKKNLKVVKDEKDLVTKIEDKIIKETISKSKVDIAESDLSHFIDTKVEERKSILDIELTKLIELDLVNIVEKVNSGYNNLILDGAGMESHKLYRKATSFYNDLLDEVEDFYIHIENK